MSANDFKNNGIPLRQEGYNFPPKLLKETTIGPGKCIHKLNLYIYTLRDEDVFGAVQPTVATSEELKAILSILKCLS